MSEGQRLSAERVHPALAAAMAAFGVSQLRPAAVGDGLINHTYLLHPGEAALPMLVLQRINPQVFADPAAVLANQSQVLTLLAALPESRLVPLRARSDGAGFGWWDDQGGCWRLQPYVAGSQVHASLVTDPNLRLAQARAAGQAFGAFQRLLQQVPATAIQPVLPHFHVLDWQFQRLDDLRQRAPADLAPELALIASQRDLVVRGVAGPWGLIHGDCKLSNLLFAAGDPTQVLAVIDLDTLMWGARAWDFGDLVRTVLSGVEDGTQVPAAAPVSLFAALAQGFLQGLGTAADASLGAAMQVAPRYMTLMLAIRFLVDHLEGDRYFRIQQPGDNLRRARQQLALTRVLAAAEPDFAQALAASQPAN